MKKRHWITIIVSQLLISIIVSSIMTAKIHINRPFDVPILLEESHGNERGYLVGYDYYEEECGSYFESYLLEQGYNPKDYYDICEHTEVYETWFVPAKHTVFYADRLKNGSFGVQQTYCYKEGEPC